MCYILSWIELVMIMHATRSHSWSWRRGLTWMETCKDTSHSFSLYHFRHEFLQSYIFHYISLTIYSESIPHSLLDNRQEYVPIRQIGLSRFHISMFNLVSFLNVHYDVNYSKYVHAIYKRIKTFCLVSFFICKQ